MKHEDARRPSWGRLPDGKDPAEARDEARAVLTVEDLADRYLSDHVNVRNRPSTQREVKRLVYKRIKPRLGHLPVKKISRSDIGAFHHALRETPTEANRVLAALSKMFNLAELWNLRPDGSNPCRLVSRFKENSRERFLSQEELRLLGVVLDSAGKSSRYHPSAINAIRLLVFSGLRVSEALALRWEDLDVKAGTLHIREAKGGPRFHSVGNQSLALVNGLDRASEWVFPAITKKGHLSINTIEKIWKRVRDEAGFPDVRLHDLRHGVGTAAGRTGANAFLIKDKLGHRNVATTSIYVNRDAAPLRALSDAVEADLVRAMKSERRQ